MLQTTAVRLREDFDREVAHCIDNHEALKVTRDRGENLVIVGEADWRAIEETLYLNRIPGLVESIRDAAREPLSEGVRLPDYPGTVRFGSDNNKRYAIARV